ncbi:MAG: SIMPL domain-containing protein [Candidatus Paceibacterota bacterium]
MENFSKSFPVAMAILGGCIIITGVIAGSYFYKVKQLTDVISVTGSADRAIRSDIIKWRFSFSRTAVESQLRTGNALLKKDFEAVKKYLADNSISAEAITISSVTVNQNYEYKDPNSPDREKTYTLSQEVKVESGEVDRITEIAKNSGVLVDEGVFLNNFPLEYYYSGIANLKVEMLAEATKNAKERASQIAQSTGAQLGNLRSAQMGVTQITPVNSTEISDYGYYDTSSIDKQITAVVRATFGLK